MKKREKGPFLRLRGKKDWKGKMQYVSKIFKKKYKNKGLSHDL